MPPKVALALFNLLAKCFDAGYRNPFIRWMYSDGVDIVIDEHDSSSDTPTTRYYRVVPEAITNQLLNNARQLHQQIKAAA